MEAEKHLQQTAFHTVFFSLPVLSTASQPNGNGKMMIFFYFFLVIAEFKKEQV